MIFALALIWMLGWAFAIVIGQGESYVASTIRALKLAVRSPYAFTWFVFAKVAHGTLRLSWRAVVWLMGAAIRNLREW